MDRTDSIPVKYDLRPAYYDDFHCLAGDCRQSCCMGWHVTFDRKDYMKLKRVHGSPELNARMAHALRRIRSGPFSEKYFGEFRLNEGDEDCPLHCENGLCLLQAERGHEMLPRVCKIFPRVENVYISGYFERALSPSCEAVLALLWNLPEGIDFLADPLQRPMTMQFPAECRGTLAESFQEIRSNCIDILQDRRMPLPERMMLLGLALKKLADGERDLERWLVYVRLLSEQAAGEMTFLGDQKQPLAPFLINNARILSILSKRNNVKNNVARELLSVLDFEQEREGGRTRGSISVEPYLQARARYEERFAGREYFWENLMVSILFRYKLPVLDSAELIWRSYLAFCNLYGFYRFLAVMSCRDGAPGDRDELFRLVVFGNREMLHDKGGFSSDLVDSLVQNDSATLAHMAVLLGN